MITVQVMLRSCYSHAGNANLTHKWRILNSFLISYQCFVYITRVAFWKDFLQCLKNNSYDNECNASIANIEILKLDQISIVADNGVDNIKIDKIGLEIFGPLMSMLSKLKHLEIRSHQVPITLTYNFTTVYHQDLSKFISYFLIANNSNVLQTLIVDLTHDIDAECFPTKMSLAIGNDNDKREL